MNKTIIQLHEKELYKEGLDYTHRLLTTAYDIYRVLDDAKEYPPRTLHLYVDSSDEMVINILSFELELFECQQLLQELKQYQTVIL
jgi:hypothetical protein